MDEKLEALKEAQRYVKVLYTGVEETVGYFRQNDNSQGYRLTSQIAEGLEWLSDVFRLTEDRQVKKIDQDELFQLLRQIIEAMENEDVLLLADLLEFELLEQITVWQSKLDDDMMHNNL